jgi:hypothetical protein
VLFVVLPRDLTNFTGREAPEPIAFGCGVADHLLRLAHAVTCTTSTLTLGSLPLVIHYGAFKKQFDYLEWLT